MVLKKIALTGASGVLGRHITALCQSCGISVITSGRSHSKRNDPVDFIWDLKQWRDSGELDAAFANVDAVVHAGALVPTHGGSDTARDFFDANVRSTLCLGEWARQHNLPLVYLSGGIVYKDSGQVDIKESAPKGFSSFGDVYGLSKWLGEEILSPSRERGLKLCTLRPSSIYGHGMAANKLIPNFLSLAARGEELVVKSPGDFRIDLIHAFDVALAILAALANNVSGDFNIASGSRPSVLELAKLCVEVSRGKGDVKQEAAHPSSSSGTRFFLNDDAAKKAFRFNPLFPIKTGLSEILRQENAAAAFVPNAVKERGLAILGARSTRL